MDMAPAHKGGIVGSYIKAKEDEGRLKIEFIDGGLTSILQVCDLTANKQIKAIIKEAYYKWRAQYIKAERSRLGDKHAHIKLKMNIEEMTSIIEKSVKHFNSLQKESRSIAKTFIKAGQDPYTNCEEEFNAHLEALAKLPSYSSTYKIEELTADLHCGLKITDDNDGIVTFEEDEESKEVVEQDIIVVD